MNVRAQHYVRAFASLAYISHALYYVLCCSNDISACRSVTLNLLNAPKQGVIEVKDAPLLIKDPSAGSRKLPLTSSVYIEQVDAQDLKEGQEVSMSSVCVCVCVCDVCQCSSFAGASRFLDA